MPQKLSLSHAGPAGPHLSELFPTRYGRNVFDTGLMLLLQCVTR